MKQKTIFANPKVKYWLTSIIYLGTISFVVYAAFKIYVWYNVQMKIVKSNLDTEVYTDANGNTISVDLSLKASQLYDAFHSGLFGWFENESECYSILKSVPAELIPKLELVYTNLTGENLKEMFVKYTDFNEVAYLFS